MHDRGKMNVVNNPSSFRNSCSLREGIVAILRLLQVTKTLIATGPMIQSAMTEWTTSPWGFRCWGLLNNQWDKSFTLLDYEALILPLPPLPPLPCLLDLAIYFQQEYCCWFRTARQKVQLVPIMSLLTMIRVGCYMTRSLGIPWHPSPVGSLWDLWSSRSLPWSFLQLSSSPSSLQAPFFFQTCVSFQKHFSTSRLLSSTPSPELSWSK